MRIHGILFVIVGAIVAIYSYMLDSKSLLLFLIAGICFILFGLFRMLTSKKQKQTSYKIAQNFCSSCGTAAHDLQNFCHNCGNRMFHKHQ